MPPSFLRHKKTGSAERAKGQARAVEVIYTVHTCIKQISHSNFDEPVCVYEHHAICVLGRRFLP